MKSLHILHLPKWYPNADDPQLGIFVQKQIQAAALFCKQSVLYIRSTDKLDDKYFIEENELNDLFEIRITYRKSSKRSKQLLQLNKMYELGFEMIDKKVGPPAIIHVHNLITPAIWANKYANKNNIPWVLSEHWSGFTRNSGHFEAKMIWEKKLWQWYSEKAACVISVSSFLDKSLKENRIGERHYVIPNVVESFIPETQRKDDEKRMLVVGDMVDEVKNISGSIDAFAKLSRKHNDLRLWIVGGGEDLEKMKDRVKDHDLLNKVVFYGRLANKDVLPIYAKIDFTLINSRVETFSVVAAESLLAGKPVISTRCGGVEEFLDERTGYLIAIDNELELIEAMEKMINDYKKFDPEIMKGIAQSAFSARSVGKSLFELYESLTK